MAKNRFEYGRSTYVCHLCGRTTRDTGEGEFSTEMCLDCFNACSWDNTFSDTEDPEALASVQSLVKIIKEKSGVDVSSKLMCFEKLTKLSA